MVMPNPSQQQQPQQAQQAPAQGQQAQQGEPQGDDQKRAMFEQLAGPKLEYIWGQGLEDVKQVLSAGADAPEQAIGDLVGKMLASSAMQARDNGSMVPPDVMTATAMELINNVTDIAVKMGVVPEEQANDIGESSFIVSIATFGQMAAQSALGPQEKQQYASIIDEMEKIAEMKGGQGQPQQQPEQPQQQQQRRQKGQQQKSSLNQDSMGG